MNREIWFRILQVAVVAPWLYHLSGSTKSPYFRVGLKLVAGSIIMLNVKPLMNDYKNAQVILADLKTKLDAANATATLPKIIEGESETVTESV